MNLTALPRRTSALNLGAMRMLTLLLGFLALLVAPLAVPAVAAEPEHCVEMAMGSNHVPAKAGHGLGEPCCVAVTSAVAPASAPNLSAPFAMAVLLNVPVAPRLLGQAPLTEDPPPRNS